MGRPPKPTAQKILQGTFRPDRANPLEPKVKTGLGKMPAGLKPAAKTHWKRCQRWLGGQVIKDCDRTVTEIMCRAVSELPEIQKIIDKDGLIQVNDNGYMQAHPAVTALRQTRELILKCSGLLGLNPSARTRISTQPESTKPSTYEDFKQGGKAKKR